MELKHYLLILLRRWPAVVALPLLVGALAVYQEATRQTVYSTTMRAAVVRVRDPLPPGEYAFDDYYNYVASEFAIDDLVEATRGNVFAQAVAARVEAGGMPANPEDVQKSMASERRQRILSITVSSNDPNRAKAIASAAVAELQASAYSYIGGDANAANSSVNVINQPSDPMPNVARARLLLALEVLAAVGAGVLLAFLVHYIDDTLYDAEGVAAALELPHLASIPAEQRA